MKKIKLGIDLGNGFIKGKSDNLELLSPGSLVLKKNVLINQKKLGENYSLYKIDGIEFVTGKELEEPNFLIGVNDLLNTYHENNNRYNLKTYQLLMLAMITDLIENEYLNQDPIEIELIIGIPSIDLISENVIIIQDFLENKIHSVMKNNKVYLFKITKTIIIEQPLAILLNLAINKNKLNKDILNDYNVIVDIGTKTTTIDVFFKSERLANKSKAFPVGIKNIYGEVLHETEYQDNLNISDIENSIKNKQDINMGRIELKFCELNKLFKRHLSVFTNLLLKVELNNLINENKELNIYLVGGGACLVSEYLENIIAYEIVEAPQVYGVRGLLKYLNAVGNDSSLSVI